ncbi:MAG TPA: copper resistance protein CopC [Actinomycetota bacterium]|nr:copper resistance protein CopC [Actinomycetota bacterium]
MDIRRLFLLATCLLVPLWASGHAAAAPASPTAAPERTGSDPAPDSHVAAPPTEVSITFSEPVDPSSGMQVVNECGERIDDRAVTVELMTMRVGISDGPSGHYVVEYLARSLNGLTGDSRGKFHFIVDSGTPCAGGHGDHGGHEEPEPPDHNHGDRDEDGEGMGDHSDDDHEGDPGTHGDDGMGDHEGEHDGTDDRPKHEGRHGKHEGKGHREPDETVVTPSPVPSPSPTFGPAAAPPPVDPPPVEREAVLTALALAGLVGSLGGWMLRV